jgi:ankyrin repeat protein
MQHLSKAVREQIFDELGKTASSDPSNTRKREAAFELAYGIFSGFDERQPKTSDLALRHLVKAAMEGHELARSVIGSVHDAFGKDLPVPSEKELEWLVHATERGDLISRSRLRTKAPALCDDALYRLRYVFCGIGIKQYANFHRSPEAFAQDAIARIELGFDTAERMLWFSAGTGNLQLARFCLTTGDCVVDQENEFKETPLLQACRAGHLDVSRFLIENGAEVACADKEGTTPLHWLPSFPATEKDEAADLLVAAGAQLEARSYNARKVYGGHHRQHRLGSYDGTPLLWATVANDVSAVRALMRHGADPWDHGGSTQPTSGSWGNQIHYSPILYAADLHMAEILEIMCQPALDNCTLSNLLNTSYRELNGGSQVDHILPLHLAVGDLGLGRFQRIILHGASHREACSNTVNFLVKSGTDAAKTDRQGVTAVQLASEVGSVDILQCLYQLRNGELKLQGKSLEKSLQVLIMMQRRQTFHFLLKVHAQDLQDAYLRSVLLVTAAEFCNDAFFAVSLLAAGPEKFSLDVSQVFEVAVDRGNFKLAQALFEQYRYDPTARRKGRSFLGLLVQKSKHSSVSLRALDYVLSLTDNSDEVFWAYEARFRDEVTRTSLLHAAVGANEFKDGIDRGTAALNLILRKFNLPKQLNAKMGGHGQTPLHVAIFCGNPEAVQTLIAEPGLDKKVLDNDGRSVLDLALLRLRNPDELLGFWNDIPSDRERNEHRMRLSSVAIIGMLLRAGFEGHRYTGRILRRSETYGELQQFVKKPSDMSTTVLGGTIDLRGDPLLYLICTFKS